MSLPFDLPSRTELWYRVQLALAVLNQRTYDADTADVAARALRGEPISALAAAQLTREGR